MNNNKIITLSSIIYMLLYTGCGCQQTPIRIEKIQNQSLQEKKLCFTKKADPPFSLQNLDVCFALKGKGYAGNDQGWAYDPTQNTWQQTTKLFPYADHKQAVAFIHQGTAYVGTGWNNGNRLRHNNIYPFPSSSKTISYPDQTAYCIAFTLKENGKEISYVGIGRHEKSKNGKYKEIYKFDGKKFDNQPIYYPEDIHLVDNSCVCTINNTAYIMTNKDLGTNNTTDYVQDFYAFTPPNNWKKLSFKEQNAIYSTMFALQGKIYVGLGSNTIPGQEAYHNTFHVYDPKTAQWETCKNEFPTKRKVTMNTHTKTFTIQDKAYIICEDSQGKLICYEARIQ